MWLVVSDFLGFRERDGEFPACGGLGRMNDAYDRKQVRRKLKKKRIGIFVPFPP